MKKALIELKGISKNFAGVKALQDVDLTIYEGETRCLAGENGCGKYTLIKIIADVYKRQARDTSSFFAISLCVKFSS